MMKTTKTTDAKTPTTAAAAPTTRIERVTPAMAAEMLSKNTRNRTLSRARMIQMAAAMSEGRWRMTHQGVAVATDGTLLDGQHRLTAVVTANVAVDMLVTRGLPPEAIDAIDTGENRRAYDVLAIADGVRLSRSERSGLLAAQELAENGTLIPSGGRPRTTVDDLRRAMREHGADMTAVMEQMTRNNDKLAAAALLGSLAIAHRTAPDATERFARMLRTGASLPEKHPALLLRNFVVMNRAANGAVARDELSLRTFVALDAFAAGSARAFLRGGETQRAKYLLPWRKDEAKG